MHKKEYVKIKGEISMIKLEDKYIKNKLKVKFGEIEVYSPQLIEGVYIKLSQMIKDNSIQIDTENGLSDVQINNTVKIIRQMLIDLTNLENEQYWNNINDVDLDNLLNLADGDFKLVVNTLIDIMLEIAQDSRLEDIRKLKIISDKIEEITEVFKFNTNIDNKLKEFGLDRDLLIKIQNGDKEAIEHFQKILIEKANKPKPKRQYTKKNKK